MRHMVWAVTVSTSLSINTNLIHLLLHFIVFVELSWKLILIGTISATHLRHIIWCGRCTGEIVMHMLRLLDFIRISSWAVSGRIFDRKMCENGWVVFALWWSSPHSCGNITWIVLLDTVIVVGLVIHWTISSLARIITLAVENIWDASLASLGSVLDTGYSVIIVTRQGRRIVHAFPLQLLLELIVITEYHIIHSLRWGIGRGATNHRRWHWWHAAVHRRLTSIDVKCLHVISTCTWRIVWFCLGSSNILCMIKYF